MNPRPERDAPPSASFDTASATADEITSSADVNHSLALRILSATVLLPLGLAAIWLGGIILAAATATAGCAMAYEWAKMQEPRRPLPSTIILCLGAILCPILAGYGHFPWMAPVLAGCAIVAALMRSNWIGRLESFCGAIYVAAPGAAFVWLRSRPDEGLALAVILACTIWASDIAAYFVGGAIGGPKILPETSPKKTWAGFAGGVIAGALAAAACGSWAGGEWALWLVAGAIISVVGHCGDMFESLVKRHFRVKDASGLIPGHGGVMDRLDALMVASLFCAIILNWAPITPELHFAALLK